MAPAAPDPNDTEIGTTDPAFADASTRRDEERWDDSYINHTATALHRRAVAAQNGHGSVRAP